MKEEEPVDGKKSDDDGIEKENLAILEKIRKNQRQDHLNVGVSWVRKHWNLNTEADWIIKFLHSLILHNFLHTLLSYIKSHFCIMVSFFSIIE